MRHTTFALALIAVAAISAGAQQPGHDMHGPAAAAHTMKTPCPLHLDGLALSAQQTKAVDSLRADHETIMKSVMPSHEMKAGHMAMRPSAASKAAMESTMRLTVAAMRSVLTDDQRSRFNAAVTAHAAEMATMKSADGGDCAACCAACAEHEKHMGMAKPE
jgi:hypothetical protein